MHFPNPLKIFLNLYLGLKKYPTQENISREEIKNGETTV